MTLPLHEIHSYISWLQMKYSIVDATVKHRVADLADELTD